MPAYKTALKQKCANCPVRAAYEVFTGQNESRGVYCGRCSDKKVRELNAWKIEPIPVRRGVIDENGGI